MCFGWQRKDLSPFDSTCATASQEDLSRAMDDLVKGPCAANYTTFAGQVKVGTFAQLLYAAPGSL
jgi:hypothetical protein